MPSHFAENQDDAELIYGEASDGEDTNFFLPTTAAPGSQEKVAILIARQAAGQPLWHPHDRVNFKGCGLEGIVRRKQ
jgi:hypothetical protein